MKLIRIINGTYGHRPAGSMRPDPKSSASPPFEVEDAEAVRLVGLKVAAYAERQVFETPDISEDDPDDDQSDPDNPKDDSGDDDEGGADDENDGGEVIEDALAADYSADMSLDELKEIFKDCGLTYRVGTSKADMVAALDAHFAADDDGEAPPVLDPEEPVT